MIPARAPPATRTVRAHRQNRLIIAMRAFAGPVAAMSRPPDDQRAGLNRQPVCVSIVISGILRSGCWQRAALSADRGDQALQMARHEPLHRSKMRDQRIALVFQVELEPMRREYRRASRRPAVCPWKG